MKRKNFSLAIANWNIEFKVRKGPKRQPFLGINTVLFLIIIYLLCKDGFVVGGYNWLISNWNIIEPISWFVVEIVWRII